MGEIIPINKQIDGFFLNSIEKINWNEANYNWNTFYADQYYAAYIYEEFGITIPNPPNAVLWNHAVLLNITFIEGNAPPDSYDQGKKKKKLLKKKIKLIFMVDDMESVFEKEKNDEVKVEFKNKVENILTEKFGQKIILENVQIIHR